MTENIVKEVLSRSFISMIVTQCGYKYEDVTSTDLGIDARIYGTINRNPEGFRLMESGVQLNCQIKATTEKSVSRSKGMLKYALETKTYNDLIFWKNNAQYPVVLFVFVLPEHRENWIECSNDHLTARRHVYWYDIPNDAEPVDKERSTRTIQIPDENVLSLATFPVMFNNFTKPRLGVI